MPRGPRLDAPGVLHHVMVRGIERRAGMGDVAKYDKLLIASTAQDDLLNLATSLICAGP
jgi:hypothetical protein